MSYDLQIHVKSEGCDIYPVIAEPELSSPTYNLGKMFRACMDWQYGQCEKGEDGEYHTCYYRCDEALPKIERGINELRTNREAYKLYEPDNGWGTLDGARRALESLRDCIYKQAEKKIPLECLYMSW
jgi:hypothetical protein